MDHTQECKTGRAEAERLSMHWLQKGPCCIVLGLANTADLYNLKETACTSQISLAASMDLDGSFAAFPCCIEHVIMYFISSNTQGIPQSQLAMPRAAGGTRMLSRWLRHIAGLSRPSCVGGLKQFGIRGSHNWICVTNAGPTEKLFFSSSVSSSNLCLTPVGFSCSQAPEVPEHRHVARIQDLFGHSIDRSPIPAAGPKDE